MVPTEFLQGLAAQFMPTPAEILRATETKSGDGTATNWATVATVAARLSPAGVGSERLGAGQSMMASAPWRISLPVGTDVTSKDRVRISARVFEVIRAAPASYAAELVLLAVELT